MHFKIDYFKLYASFVKIYVFLLCVLQSELLTKAFCVNTRDLCSVVKYVFSNIVYIMWVNVIPEEMKIDIRRKLGTTLLIAALAFASHALKFTTQEKLQTLIYSMHKFNQIFF